MVSAQAPKLRHNSCRILLFDLLLISAASALLIRPLFKARFLIRWNSIESTFIADARFLASHWPHTQWQPLWYCGTRFDYIYPPVLRYGSALLARFYTPVEAYHIFTAAMFSIGIAGVYFLVRVMSESRASAWFAAVGCALVSPSFLFIPAVRADAPYLMPQRLGVLLRYGEGPHISAISFLPFALTFAFIALQRKRPGALALAAVFCALVALTNFYGATSLALMYPILVWAVWTTTRDNGVVLRAAMIPALAYALSAFWLTPSYLKITWDNLRYVAEPGNKYSLAIATAAVIAFAVASFVWAAGRRERAYPVFATGLLLCFGLTVLGYFAFHFLIVGDARRLIPELDMVMLMCGAEALRRLWGGSHASKGFAILVIAIAAWSARGFVRNAWGFYLPDPDYRQRIEYRMPEWVAGNLPQARTLVDGSVRFWWDAWRDLKQVDGGSDQGLLNPNPPMARWEFREGRDPEASVLWLKALGADAVIVSDETSQDAYKGYLGAPHKYDSVLLKLYDDHQGDAVYRVPRRFDSLGRVVRTADLKSELPVKSSNDVPALRAYVAVVEGGPDLPTTVEWEGPDAMQVKARVEAGDSVVVQETYDPGWHAYANGRPLRISKDAMDFIVIEAPAGDEAISLVFEKPLENRIGFGVTLLAIAACVALPAAGSRKGSGGPIKGM